MTWGECRLIALQTMFANEGKTINADDSNQDYLDAMPGKANEAMQQITMVGRPLLKSFRVKIESGAAEEATGEQLTLPAGKVRYKLDMKKYCPRWRAMNPGQIYLDDGTAYGQANDYDLEGDAVLVLPGTVEGTYTIWYHAYPLKITSATEDDENLEMPEEAAVLIPLYIAAELYKDDELSTATVLRNEFEDGLTKLREAWQSTMSGYGTGKVRNTTGWW